MASLPPSTPSRQPAEEASDESIGARLLRNDATAWDVVFDQVFPRVRKILESRFGPDKRYWSADDALGTAARTIIRRFQAGFYVEGLRSWESVRCLIVAVASNKIRDNLRRAKLEGKWMSNAYSEALRAEARDANQSPVLSEALAAEWDGFCREAVAILEGSLADDVERLVFRGKLEGKHQRLRVSELAERIEAETGEPMTKTMVTEHWRAMRARFQRTFPELRDDPSDPSK